MADETPRETGFFRGEGGTVFEMDLPLSEVMADKVTKGQLRRVADMNGSPYEGDVDDPAQGAAVTARPANSANKAEWVGWAVHQGAQSDDAEAMTKQDLVEKYGGGE